MLKSKQSVFTDSVRNTYSDGSRCSEEVLDPFSDWSLFELILFNIIQNSVKYNQQLDGDICILVSVKPQKGALRLKRTYDITGVNHILETQIIDTGIGIAEDR